MTSLFPNGTGMTTRDGVHVASAIDVNAIFAADDVVAQAIETRLDPFNLDENCNEILAILNEGGSHWTCLRVMNTIATIAVYDSADPGNGVESVRVCERETKLRRMFDHFCRNSADRSWRDCVGAWEIERPKSHQQTNGFDCGIHAMQNLIDLATTSSVQPYHDGEALRYRSAVRMLTAVSSAFEWGAPTPGEEDFRRVLGRWSSDGDVAALGASMPPFTCKVVGSLANIHRGSMPVEDDHRNAFGSIKQFTGISYLTATYAILHGYPEGLPLEKIAAGYESLSSQLGR